jgi:TetR/AcrR family transcriptional regulator, transcriptional repressor for nem operon
MNKGELTKINIIEKAAGLFNSHGFAGTSLSSIMKYTGLKKGGIYNHFKSKEEILIEAFDYAVKGVEKKIIEEIKTETTAVGKLKKIIMFFREYPINPVVKGGCPILNSMIYADNTLPELKTRVKKTVDHLLHTFESLIESGIKAKEIKRTVDPKKTAILILSALEGGVAVSRNSEDPEYMDVIIDHLNDYIDRRMIR